jgi:taurine dioxygenase
MQAKRLTPAIGALISGINLCEPLTPAQCSELLALLVENHVLFFENQPLTPRQHRDLAANFGSLHVHPVYPHDPEVEEIIVLDTNVKNPPDSDTWHTDVPFIECPPMGSLLSARVIPPSGGDTLWSSCIAAYDALDDEYKSLIENLTAEHDLAAAFTDSRYGESAEAREQLATARKNNPPMVHPVVRTHPVSGKRGIYVNQSFTTRIIELAPDKSTEVLQFLTSHVARPEFVVQWKWKPYDLAFWDNRLTQHFANADYLPHRRVMHRATILGDKPFR